MQEISQQVVTRIQDLTSEFSKIFRGWYPRTLTAGGGNPLPHPTPSPTLGRARGANSPVLGPKPWSPSIFQPWLRPSLPQHILTQVTVHQFLLIGFYFFARTDSHTD